MVTIYDIAKITGFSAPTISKALNGAGSLSKKTRDAIVEVAENIGYKPNMAARSLITKKSNLIGVIYSDAGMKLGFSHPLFSGVLDSFRTEMQKYGYDLLFLSNNFGDQEMSYLEHCQYRNIDGVILASHENAKEQIEALLKSSIPCVSVNDVVPDVCTIISSNERSGFQAAEHFIKNGHTNIGFLGTMYDYDRSPASPDREKGFCDALKTHGLDCQKYIGYCDYWHEQSGYDGAKALLSKYPEITALFIASDTQAFGAMKYCKEVGIKIPEDISIIGFDDDRVSSYCNPPLTTFKQDKDAIAKHAAEILLKKIQGETVPELIQIPAELIIRESVKELC